MGDEGVAEVVPPDSAAGASSRGGTVTCDTARRMGVIVVEEPSAPRRGGALESLCLLPLSPSEQSERFAMDLYEVELRGKEILHAIPPTLRAS